MRIVAQTVINASVAVKGKNVGAIKNGLLLFLGIEPNDTETDADWLIGKMSKMRLFKDVDGVANLSVIDIEGSFLVVSQFTLHATTKKGNRPGYYRAAKPEHAQPLYDYFLEQLWLKSERPVEAGIFGAHMEVSLINDGPITILIDSKIKE